MDDDEWDGWCSIVVSQFATKHHLHAQYASWLRRRWAMNLRRLDGEGMEAFSECLSEARAGSYRPSSPRASSREHPRVR